MEGETETEIEGRETEVTEEVGSLGETRAMISVHREETLETTVGEVVMTMVKIKIVGTKIMDGVGTSVEAAMGAETVMYVAVRNVVGVMIDVVVKIDVVEKNDVVERIVVVVIRETPIVARIGNGGTIQEVIQEVTKEVIQEVTQEVTQEATQEVTRGVIQEATRVSIDPREPNRCPRCRRRPRKEEGVEAIPACRKVAEEIHGNRRWQILDRVAMTPWKLLVRNTNACH